MANDIARPASPAPPVASAPKPGKELKTPWTVLIQIVVATAALVVICSSQPWLGGIPFALLAVAGLALQLAPSNRQQRAWRWLLNIAFVASLSIPVSLFLLTETGFTLERYMDHFFAVLAWLSAMTVLVTASYAAWSEPKRAEESAGRNGLALTVAVFSAATWVSAAYWHNARGAFSAGLLAMLGLLILWRLWFRLPGLVTQFINTLLLLGIVLPLADLCFHSKPTHAISSLVDWKQFYSYKEAKGDPARFAEWSRFFDGQVNQILGERTRPDPAGILPFRLRPGTTQFFESSIRINSHGFRGAEILTTNVYRIVALGESTTFGMTLRAEDRPWPELLEGMIRERLKSARTVEVINAGVPTFALNNNLARVISDILPLKPDLIISYHGANGFSLINPTLPTPVGGDPPAYQPRALRLLANAEFGLRAFIYTQRHLAMLRRSPSALNDPLTSEYARVYEQLIRVCQTNRVRLALANYCMAVNRQSLPRVIEFYRPIYRAIYRQIEANEAHSQIIEQLGRRHPEVCVIDTHPQLDGQNEKFIDLLHFTQEGRQQLAEAIFAGIKPILSHGLGLEKAAGP